MVWPDADGTEAGQDDWAVAEAAKTAATPDAQAAPQKSWPVEHPAAVGTADPAPLPRAFLVMRAVSTPGSMEARSATTKKATKVASRFYMGGSMPREGAAVKGHHGRPWNLATRTSGGLANLAAHRCSGGYLLVWPPCPRSWSRGAR